MTPTQLGLFEAPPALPAGFRYRPDLLSPEDERALVCEIAALPLRPFEFHGYVGHRRVISFGWHYEFGREELQPAEPIPAFLLPPREAMARFAGLDPESLPHVLITEYAPGAAIGWHRDKGVFGDVVGLSLLSPCVFRLRRRRDRGWERASVTAEPRSAYLLRGAARTEWEHSIPAVGSLRYSITFRTLR